MVNKTQARPEPKVEVREAKPVSAPEPKESQRDKAIEEVAAFAETRFPDGKISAQHIRQMKDRP